MNVKPNVELSCIASHGLFVYLKTCHDYLMWITHLCLHNYKTIITIGTCSSLLTKKAPEVGRLKFLPLQNCLHNKSELSDSLYSPSVCNYKHTPKKPEMVVNLYPTAQNTTSMILQCTEQTTSCSGVQGHHL